MSNIKVKFHDGPTTLSIITWEKLGNIKKAKHILDLGYIPINLDFRKEPNGQKYAVATKEFMKLVSLYGSDILTKPISIDGNLFLLTQFQQHPITEKIIHLNFVLISDPNHIKIPSRVVLINKNLNYENCNFHVERRTIPIVCTVDKIPATIEIDVSTMKKNDIVTTDDLLNCHKGLNLQGGFKICALTPKKRT